MEYKLFDDYITLQALLKEMGIIQSGGAVKVFLKDYQVFFNGEAENRRGKKIRIGDRITIPAKEIDLLLIAPNQEEIREHEQEKAEKQRLSQLVKEMNKEIQKTNAAKKGKRKKTNQSSDKAIVRFPGT